MGSTQRYAIHSSQIAGQRIEMNKQDSHHMVHVMRSKVGDVVICFDESGCLYHTKIETLQPLVLSIVSMLDENNELDIEVVLIYGLPKLEKFEYVLQKATELGVTRVIPWMSRRSIIKLDKDKVEKKLLRWQAIIKEAAEQSHRTYLPVIERPISTKELCQLAFDEKLIAYENNENKQILTQTIKKMAPRKSLALVIGPEGGIDDQELDMLKLVGFVPCSLGKRILRTETAAISMLSAVVLIRELGE